MQYLTYLLRFIEKRPAASRAIDLFSHLHDYLLSNLTNQIDARLQGRFSFFPFSRTNFSFVACHKLGSLYFAEQLGSVAADVVVVQFHHLNLSFGVDRSEEHTFELQS